MTELKHLAGWEWVLFRLVGREALSGKETSHTRKGGTYTRREFGM